MARRILEAEMREKLSIAMTPIGPAKGVTVKKEFKFHPTFRGVFSLQFNFSGELLVAGFGSGGIQLFDVTSLKMTKELRACRQGGHSVMVLRFHPKDPDILYAADTEGFIYIFNVETGSQVGQIQEVGNEINCLDFCCDGYNFASGGKDLGIRVYETKTNKLVQEYQGFNRGSEGISNSLRVTQTMRVFALKFHQDNQYIFVSGGWDNQLKIWDIRSNDGIKRSIRGPHICGDSLDMKDNIILSGQWTALHALQEYNYTEGKVSKEIKFPHTSDGAFLYCAQYLNPDLVAAGGSGTNSVELVEVSTNRHVGGVKLSAPVQALDSAKGGRLVAVGGSQSSLFLLDVSD